MAALALITSINPSYSRSVGLAASYKWRSAGATSSLSLCPPSIYINIEFLLEEWREKSEKGVEGVKARARKQPDNAGPHYCGEAGDGPRNHHRRRHAPGE